MSNSLLQGIRTLFSTSSANQEYFKATSDKFIRSLYEIREILKSSGKAEWRNFAERLKTAPQCHIDYSNKDYFIHKTATDGEMYVKTTTFQELRKLCIDALQSQIDCKVREKFLNMAIIIADIQKSASFSNHITASANATGTRTELSPIPA